MSRALKAALLSALVFPGSGHFFLKSRLKGTLLVCAAIACLYILLSTTLDIADEISIKIQTGALPMEASALTDAITNQLADSSSQNINIASALLLTCWLIGIVDSYRIGRSQKNVS